MQPAPEELVARALEAAKHAHAAQILRGRSGQGRALSRGAQQHGKRRCADQQHHCQCDGKGRSENHNGAEQSVECPHIALAQFSAAERLHACGKHAAEDAGNAEDRMGDPGCGHGLSVKEVADDQTVDQPRADIGQLDQRKGDKHGEKALIQNQPAI